LKIRSFTI